MANKISEEPLPAGDVKEKKSTAKVATKTTKKSGLKPKAKGSDKKGRLSDIAKKKASKVVTGAKKVAVKTIPAKTTAAKKGKANTGVKKTVRKATAKKSATK